MTWAAAVRAQLDGSGFQEAAAAVAGRGAGTGPIPPWDQMVCNN